MCLCVCLCVCVNVSVCMFLCVCVSVSARMHWYTLYIKTITTRVSDFLDNIIALI